MEGDQNLLRSIERRIQLSQRLRERSDKVSRKMREFVDHLAEKLYGGDSPGKPPSVGGASPKSPA